MSDLKPPDINDVTIAGRLTRDPELRYLNSGDAVCNIAVAVSRKFKGRDGQTREESLFVNCVCWRKQAEYVGENFKKGRPVIIHGSLKSEEWEDKATGQKRTTIKINVRRIQALDWDGSGGKSAQPAPSAKPVEGPMPEDDIPF